MDYPRPAKLLPAQHLAAPVTEILVLPLHGGAALGAYRELFAGAVLGQLPDGHGLTEAQSVYSPFHSFTISTL